MNGKKLLPPTYLLFAILAMIILHFIYTPLRLIPMAWNLLGTIPIVIGILINIFADRSLHKAQTTVKPYEESNALVTDGVYRISRNPMYLGFAFILIGTGILLGTLLPWLIPPIFIVLMQIQFIREEECMLTKKFGLVWVKYKSKVRRWI